MDVEKKRKEIAVLDVVVLFCFVFPWEGFRSGKEGRRLQFWTS
jgi:hypothetical protein